MTDLQNHIDAQIEKVTSKDPDQDVEAQDVLFVLRQIIHATDKQSRNMVGKIGITGPQYALLSAIRDLGEVTTRQLSNHVSLTQATVTTILARLQARGLIERYRSEKDRRIVHSRLSGDSEALLKRAPSLMQTQFSERFAALSKAQQQQIFNSFADVAKMMGAEEEEPSFLLITPEELKN
ncbi:MarR family winged helix-turn-helix transcriptional regulator [Parasphingorhabdus sp. DH2-15]|uniref:MarR family winged helix-turn-helix transcriptional regulator n=1 Tax=Parasphingorhabdus sp. DH2-15 TaxID=3444112 RepID=UPI003F6858D4